MYPWSSRLLRIPSGTPSRVRATRLCFVALLVAGTPGTALAQVYLNSNTTTQLTTGMVWPLHYQGCEAGYQGSTSTNTTAAEQNEFTLSTPYQQTGGTYQAFWSADSSCSAPDGGSSTLPMTIGLLGGTQAAEEVTVNLESILVSVTGLSDPCDAKPAISGTGYICITEQSYSLYGGSYSIQPFYLTVVYDMSPPPQPTAFSVTPADSELDVGWTYPYDPSNSSGSNADHFLLYYQQDPTLTPDAFGNCTGSGVDGGSASAADGGVDGGAAGGGADAGADGGTDGGSSGYGPQPSTAPPSSGSDPTAWPNPVSVPNPGSNNLSYALSGLTNGACYDVAVAAVYPDSTVGYTTTVVTRAPIEIFDYWRLYHTAGGNDSGGLHCQASGGGLAPLAMVLAALLILRTRRRRPQ